MPLLTIKASYVQIPPGTYRTIFHNIEAIETKNGKAHRWIFKDKEKNLTITDLSDAERPPSTRNRTGRWLAALSGKPLEDNLSVNTDEHVGRPYLVIVSSRDSGGTRIDTFTAL